MVFPSTILGTMNPSSKKNMGRPEPCLSPRLGGDDDSEEEEDEKNDKKTKPVEKLSDGKQQKAMGCGGEVAMAWWPGWPELKDMEGFFFSRFGWGN